MGSLVPGWDTLPGVPPKDLQEFNEAQEGSRKEGYFAKLEKTKTLKRTSVEPHNLQSHPLLSPIPSLQRSSSIPLGGALYSSSMGSPSFAGHRDHHGHLAPPPVFKTDWESELKSLSTNSKRGLARTSVEPPSSHRSSAEHHSSAHAHPNHTEPHWWAHLDSSALNRAPGSSEAEANTASAQELRGSFRLDLPTSINLH